MKSVTHFDEATMNNQQKLECEIQSIGDIGLTKAETTLYFDTESVPAKVSDKNDTLICFYAKQVMTAYGCNEGIATKENQHLNEPSAVSLDHDNDVLTKVKEDYWYFFSPLYFGESPVACITCPQWEDDRGKICIYTFKRMRGQQVVASSTNGYFGGKCIKGLSSLTLPLLTAPNYFYRTNIFAWISFPKLQKHILSVLPGCL